jgi:hypothetical protein
MFDAAAAARRSVSAPRLLRDKKRKQAFCFRPGSGLGWGRRRRAGPGSGGSPFLGVRDLAVISVAFLNIRQ